MVDGVGGAKRVKLQQALHGYAEGHRQLASSIQLKSRDAKTMLVLSDISGSGARVHEAGYLTGYPLAEAGLYAFARTWPAPEMPRPGCVWSHTLLIDFADLAALPSLTELLRAFQRPRPEAESDYGKPLTLEWADGAAYIEAADEPWARRIVGALYGKPSARIIASRADHLDADVLITAIWSQQWPRLRRSFRFCTLAATDRSIERASFDLQLLPTDNQAFRTRFPKAVDAESVTVSGVWLDDTVADLLSPRRRGLRRFLRQIGGDVSKGRAAFPTLCVLYRLIESFATDSDAVEKAIALLQDELGTAQARTARAIIAGAALPEAERLNEKAFDYLLAHLDLIEPETISEAADVLGRVILRRRPTALATMVGADSPLARIPEKTFASATTSELIDGLSAEPKLGPLVLRERPQLAADPAFWVCAAADDAGFEILRGSENRQPIVAAMIVAGRADLADRAVRDACELEVLRALATFARSNESAGTNGQRWVPTAAQPGAVSKLFASADPTPRPLLVMIARVIGPDDVPNDFGEDPWLTAIRRTDGQVSEADETYLRSYLLARCLGWRSRSQAELAQLGFESTHNAAARNQLREESWRWLEPRLPWSILWFDWDRCQRLRAGVVSLFVERQLSPEIFGRLVDDESLFAALAEQAARTSSGRGYLKYVRRALKDAPQDTYSARRRFIEKLVK